VVYKVPDGDGQGEAVCIIDSAASMANHLETVCLAGPNEVDLHAELTGLPYVACATEDGGTKRTVCTTLTEGHRLASDYFIGPKAMLGGQPFRDVLRKQMGVKELSRDKKYFFYPANWGDIYTTVFEYDPNSLVHGLLFAREAIKVSRLLTAHHEAHGAQRVNSSGVKFDKLGKTLSGQPIFSVAQQTGAIVATFVFDLALLRSYGRNGKGLTEERKLLLLELGLWKIKQLTDRPFRYRSNCYLQRKSELETSIDGQPIEFPGIDIVARIAEAGFADGRCPTEVMYPANDLYRVEEPEKKGKKKVKQPESEEPLPEEG
jgi:CRISPR-associated protein Csb1